MNPQFQASTDAIVHMAAMYNVPADYAAGYVLYQINMMLGAKGPDGVSARYDDAAILLALSTTAGIAANISASYNADQRRIREADAAAAAAAASAADPLAAAKAEQQRLDAQAAVHAVAEQMATAAG